MATATKSGQSSSSQDPEFNYGYRPDQQDAADLAEWEREQAWHAARDNSSGQTGAEQGEQSTGPEDSNTESPEQLADREASTNPQGFGYAEEEGSSSPGKPKGRAPKSRLKQGLAAGTILIAGGGVAAIISFLSLAPLKLIGIDATITDKFSAAVTDALDKEVNKMFEGYWRNVLRSVYAGQCHSTIDINCTVGIKEKGPIGRMYKTWSDQRLQLKLARDHGIVVGRQGSGPTARLIMTVNGKTAAEGSPLQDVMNGNKSIFTLGPEDVKEVNPIELAQAFNDAVANETRFKQAYLRFKYGKLFEEYWNTSLRSPHCKLRCVVTDTLRNKITVPLAERKLAAKGWAIQSFLSPLNENLGLVTQCVLVGADFCNTDLDKMSPEDVDRLSPLKRQVRTQFLDFAAKNTEETVQAVVEKSKAASEKGFTSVITRSLATNLVKVLGGDEAAQALADKIAARGLAAIPYVDLVILDIQLETFANKIGPVMRVIRYTVITAEAVQVYEMYHTAAAENKTGNVDPVALESFNNSLSTNLSGSSQDRIDITESPLWGAQFGDNDPNTPVRCNNGQKVPSSTHYCPELNPFGGNPFADIITNASELLPWQPYVAALGNAILNFIGKLAGPPLEAAFNAACNAQVGCPDAMNLVAQKTDELSKWLIGMALNLPNTEDLDGARIGDMMMLGAKYSFTKSCELQLGCAVLNPQQSATIYNSQAAEEKTTFERQSLFARLFSTDTPYSLVSRMAITMPADMPTFANKILASIIGNPFGKLASTFGNIFISNKASAATTQTNLFGIPDLGYPSVDADPENYLNQNCPGMGDNDFNGDLEGSMNKIRADWLNSQPETEFGKYNEPVKPFDNTIVDLFPTTSNECLLIGSTLDALGGASSTSLAAPGSLNPDPSSQGQ